MELDDLPAGAHGAGDVFGDGGVEAAVIEDPRFQVILAFLGVGVRAFDLTAATAFDPA